MTFEHRAEQLGQNVNNYFVAPSFYDQISSNGNVIIEGGRGSGKSSILLSMSLQHIALDHEKLNEHWNSKGYTGCYYRTDVSIVSSFYGNLLTINEWMRLFTHYIILKLCIILLRNTLILSSNAICRVDMAELMKVFNCFVGYETISNLREAITFLDRQISNLVFHIHNLRKTEKPFLVNSDLLINLVDTLRNNNDFSRKSFFFLIDEYENLFEYQKIIVNTLVKRASKNLVFKVAVRTNGFSTRKTINNNEFLLDPCDFLMINLETHLYHEYENFLKKICYIRLKVMGIKNEHFLNIENILPGLPPEEEASILLNDKHPIYLKVLKQKLDLLYDSFTSKQYYDKLVDLSNHLFGRFNLFLIETRFDIEYLITLITIEKSTYNKLYYSGKIGVLYLLCKEEEVERIYSGFKTLAYFSSGIARSFISIINNLFNISFDSDSQPIFSIFSQNKALRHSSYGYVQSLSLLHDPGPEIAEFVRSIGRIFRELNSKGLEYSKFTVLGGRLKSKEALKILSLAIQWSVIQVEYITRKPLIEGDDISYHLNRLIYPFFEISHRPFRKLDIPVNYFEVLLIGKKDERIIVENEIINKQLIYRKKEKTMEKDDNIFKNNSIHTNNETRMHIETPHDLILVNSKESYDLAISFAGEDRRIVGQIADQIKALDFKVFYDKYEQVDLLGKDLYQHLTEVYRDKSRFCLMIISKYYVQKHWTNLERKAAQARAFRENREYILPLRLDDTEIPGILDTTGYLDLRCMSIESVVEILKNKLSNERYMNN